MKKMVFVTVLIVLMISINACNQESGKTNNVEVSIGKSDTFSKDEINRAIDSVMIKFEDAKDFKGGNLTKLWHDEEKSNSFKKEYLTNVNGRGLKDENVIFLFSNFDVENLSYTDFYWILTRDSKIGDWKVYGWDFNLSR